jgi:hypothetical protein
MDYNYLILGHLLGVVIFVAGHGISMALIALMRRERNVDRLRAMLDMSLGGLFATMAGCCSPSASAPGSALPADGGVRAGSGPLSRSSSGSWR